MTTPGIEPPIPLSTPDGVVVGYLCPRCLRTAGGLSSFVRTKLDLQAQAEVRRQHIARCCVCKTCGGPTDGEHLWRCAVCYEAERPAREARALAAQNRDAETAAVRAASLERTQDIDAADALLDFMSELSEDCYCAGWLIGTEHALWRAHEEGPMSWGQGDVGASAVAKLRRLSAKAGGWWRWDDEHGPLFVLMDEWRGEK